MLYKDLMTKDTYTDLQDYLELGEDAITLMGYDRSGSVDGTKLIKRFQTTADPELMGMVNSFSGDDVMIGVPKYADRGYSSFVVRDKSLSIRYPLTGTVGAVKKYFTQSEKTCPNFKSVINEIERAFKVKVKDDERISKPISYFGGTIRLAGRFGGEKVSEADKLVQVFNLLAKNAIKDKFKNTTNPDRVKFATELLTTMFIAESYDLGVNFNRKIDNALRLQLSNTIAALGNANKETINLISSQAEKAVAKFLKKSGKSPSDIVKTLTKLGYTYTKNPTNLYEVLFGERKNYMFTQEVSQKDADEILGKVTYYDETQEENNFAKDMKREQEKYDTKKQIPGTETMIRLEGEEKPSEKSIFDFADDMVDELGEGLKIDKKVPDVIHLPGKVEEKPDVIILPGKVEPKLPEMTLEQFVAKLLEENENKAYIKAIEGKIDHKKSLFGGKTQVKDGVSERTLKTIFDKAVVKELESACKEIVSQFRKEKGQNKDVLSDIYNQLTHAKQFFGKSSDRKDIRAVSGKIVEAKKVKLGLVKPLEERRKEFIEETMAYQDALRGYAPTEDIKAKIKSLSDAKKIKEMVNRYVQSQKDAGIEK